jgi:hypothetical protein
MHCSGKEGHDSAHHARNPVTANCCRTWHPLVGNTCAATHALQVAQLTRAGRCMLPAAAGLGTVSATGVGAGPQNYTAFKVRAHAQCCVAGCNAQTLCSTQPGSCPQLRTTPTARSLRRAKRHNAHHHLTGTACCPALARWLYDCCTSCTHNQSDFIHLESNAPTECMSATQMRSQRKRNST